MTSVIRSISFEQDEILKSIIELYCNSGFECDVTYGNGAFYKNIPEPALKFDINPLSEDVHESCSTNLPIVDGIISNLVFDPPFLTYVRKGRSGNGNMVMAKRFSGYWRYDELEEHYKKTLKESNRVLKNKGIMVFKCQDIIHNHKHHSTHSNVILWAKEIGLELVDLFILNAKHRMPSPNRNGKQKHARIFHSYFLVLQKKG